MEKYFPQFYLKSYEMNDYIGDYETIQSDLRSIWKSDLTYQTKKSCPRIGPPSKYTNEWNNE